MNGFYQYVKVCICGKKKKTERGNTGGTERVKRPAVSKTE